MGPTDWWRSLQVYIGAFAAVTVGVVGLGIFVVRLIRREEYLARTQQDALIAAEDGSRAKSTFLATISHELRTPLNSILGFSSLIADQAVGPVSAPQYRDYADNIRRSGAYLLDLNRRYAGRRARLEAGMLKLTPEPVDLCAEIESGLQTVRPEAEHKQLTLGVDCPSDLPALEMDRRALRRILLNLLGNAVKFTARGEVVLRVRPLTQDDGRVTLQLSASGLYLGRVRYPPSLQITELVPTRPWAMIAGA